MLQEITVEPERCAVVRFQEVTAIGFVAVEAPQLLAGEDQVEDIAAALGQSARAFLDHVRVGYKNVRYVLEQAHHPLFGAVQPLPRWRSQRHWRRWLKAHPMLGRQVLGVEAEK